MADRSEASLEISRLSDKARRDMASMEKNEAAMAGCLAAFALVLVALFTGIAAMDTYGIGLEKLPFSAVPFILIGLAVMLLPAVLTFNWVRRVVYTVETARNAELLARFQMHFRGVLYDRGLLALVLGNDPVYNIPSIAQRLGLEPGQGQRGTSKAMASFSERIELLLNYYGLVCKHYRIEPFPEDNPFAGRGVDVVRLRGLPRRAMIFALAEGIGGSDADGM